VVGALAHTNDPRDARKAETFLKHVEAGYRARNVTFVPTHGMKIIGLFHWDEVFMIESQMISLLASLSASRRFLWKKS
jgi:hypothetical protein